MGAALLAAPGAVAATEQRTPDKTMAIGVARGHTQPQPPQVSALISIILDDLGEQQAAGLRAIQLPGAVACAFLPNTRHGQVQAEFAHRRGKEVLLHVPLQPGSAAQRYPAGLGLSNNQAEMAAYLQTALDSVPHARGVNNHQGSLLTQMPQHMDWLMAELKLRPGLYFVDSRTSASSIAYRVALARAIPAAERQIFLDAVRGEDAVRAAFQQLVQYARRNQRALAIGHPYPETFKVLEEQLPRLAQYGVKLVPPSELIASQSQNSQPPRNDARYKQLKLSPALAAAAPGSGRAAAH